MANANVDVVYKIYANNINDAIDTKNKIIFNIRSEFLTRSDHISDKRFKIMLIIDT